jgi:hypothetical protein
MSLDEDLAKARATEQKLVGKLNQEESWVSKHPGWITIGALILLGVIVVLLIKVAHSP